MIKTHTIQTHNTAGHLARKESVHSSHRIKYHSNSLTVSKLKEIFIPKRLAIVGLVFGLSHLIGNSLTHLIGNNQTPQATSSSKANTHTENENKHSFKETAEHVGINFLQLLFSSMLAISLEAVWIRGIKRPKEFSAQVFSNNSLSIAFSLAAFNSLLEGASHYFNKNKDKAISLGTSLIQVVGSFLVARAVGGAHSISSILTAACPCCSMPICIIELFNICKSLLDFGFKGINADSKGSSIQA